MDLSQPLRPARSSRRLVGLLGCAAVLAVVASAHAQQQPLRITPPAVDASEKATREQELERVRAEQRKAAETAAKLAAEIDAIGQDRRKLAKALIDTATRLRDVEARAAAAEARLKALGDNERTIRTTLEGRRTVIAELLAALQRIGRRPPPALMVRPEDALDSVRTAIMLGAVVPEMRVEVETLAADLTELVRVRRDIGEERATLARDLASLSDERQRMTLLVEERQKRQTEAERALDSERQRAATLARQADSLKDLIAKLEQDAAAAARAVPEARDSGAAAGRNSAVLRDAPRLAPAVAFASAKGALPLPVNGVRIKDYGAADKFGGIEKGLSIATRTGAQVTAPCDGWVVYAGPFRSYGQLLILNAGGGYHVLLAGMERISVDLGQFVLTGEPVAVMGGGTQTAASIALGSSQPILYVEFRKDGTPVDPGPWWAATDSEKVRG
jgi:septal ring factor EnvC (AmiA/AmiB activator)